MTHDERPSGPASHHGASMSGQSSAAAEPVTITSVGTNVAPDFFDPQDFLSPETLLNPFGFYRKAMATAPVVRIEMQDRSQAYLVTGYALVQEAFQRDADFCNGLKSAFLLGVHRGDPEVRAIMAEGWHEPSVLVAADPPAHTDQRRLTLRGFSPRIVNAMADHIRARAVKLIDDIALRGECEFISDFVVKLLVGVIADEVGATGREADVNRWTSALADRMSQCATREREIECARQIVAAQTFIESVLNDRRKNPREDFMTALVSAMEDVPGVTEEVLIAMVTQLMIGGQETGTITLSDGLLLLIQNPALINRLRSNPADIGAFVEEALRYISPVTGTIRYASRDTELGGVSIPKDSMVMLRLAAANRDPAVFSNPDAFDIDRPGLKNHFAFGRGAHTCLGRPLASLELRIAFEELLSRLDNIRLAEGKNSFERNVGLVSTGLKELHIRFDRRATG
ncbi:MAG: cytochrome P450 [Steroidobacteraceae bacterium]